MQFIPFIVTNYGEEYQTLLTGPRLHFSGNFICDPATVNNDIRNFDITSFVSHHALPSSEGGRGLYSPRGTNSFLLKDVSVKSVCYANQTCTDDSIADLVVGKDIKGTYQHFFLACEATQCSLKQCKHNAIQ